MSKQKTNRLIILTEKLEGVSRSVFEKHKKILIESIGKKSGVYALYDKKELYYVGRAVDLTKRVKDHLKDRHSELWTHFSVYFCEKEEQVSDIESVVVSIARPKGNKAMPKLGKKTQLKFFIKKAIKEKQKRELRELFVFEGQTKPLNTKRSKPISNVSSFKNKKNSLKMENKKEQEFQNYFENTKPLRAIYKGKTYNAKLLTSGKIKHNNKIYNSPSGAAKSIIDSGHTNGRCFWQVKDNANNWTRLSELKQTNKSAA